MATSKKKPTARHAAAGSKRSVAAKKTAKKKASAPARKAVAAASKKGAKKVAAKKVAVKKAAKKPAAKRPAVKKVATRKSAEKKGAAKKSANIRAAVKKAAGKKSTARKVVPAKSAGKKPAAQKPVARKGAAKKKSTRKSTARTNGAANFKGLPPLIRPSGLGETVIVEDITITNGKEVVFEMELVYTERVVTNDHVFDLHTQRDDKGQVIIDVYHVRQDGLVSISGHRRIIYIGEAINDLLTNDEYLQEYTGLKQALESLVLPE